MLLTAAQLQSLKADIAANTATIPAGQSWTGSFAGTQVKNVPPGGDGDVAVAGWYSLLANPAYFLIRTDAPVADIFDNIQWAGYTPNVAVTSSLTAAQASQCQAASGYADNKQFNIQIMLQGRTTFDATKKSQTGGLKDATTSLPTGNNFAVRDAGWTGIVPILQRQARNVEKLLAVVSTVSALQNAVSARGTQYDGTNGNPDVPVFEGPITGTDVLNARNS